jgi:predicted nuclease of predicted toxin-antitoxin system
MKFLADMGISPDTVVWLRSLSHDAVHLHEQGLDRLPDSEILIKATQGALKQEQTKRRKGDHERRS